MTAEANKERVKDFWHALYQRRWDTIATFFGENSEYTDVPSPPDDMARGPDLMVTR